MTKVYKLEVLVVDYEAIGRDAVEFQLEHSPRNCSPTVMAVEEREIEWADDHPLNRINTMHSTYQELFK